MGNKVVFFKLLKSSNRVHNIRIELFLIRGMIYLESDFRNLIDSDLEEGVL